MDRITLENYRCFREKQTARLAPLTLLVGENSTGKTSFLALVRALWDVGFRRSLPDFRKVPYDLGTFREIAHSRGGRGGQAQSFLAGYGIGEEFSLEVQFESLNANPYPRTRRVLREGIVLEAKRNEDWSHEIHLTTPNIDFSKEFKKRGYPFEDSQQESLTNLVLSIMQLFESDDSEDSDDYWESDDDKTEAHSAEWKDLEMLLEAAWRVSEKELASQAPFASAPIRSRPIRTYDPIPPLLDPRGEYVPTYLASLFHSNKKEWARLKGALETFGQESGLFDEINIKSLGLSEGSPFQVLIRKFSGRLKGVRRNLIDVGYGVSQALPLLTELLRDDAPSMFLLQQPEVHLHPSAQAALGSLFCNIAGPERQLIVETHSDYILDRVRMDIRDKKSDLKPEDVSILFFEAGELDVTIHSLRLDQEGNVLDAPPGYGQFFMDETRRSIGI